MKEFLQDLKKVGRKYFSENETIEVVNYYEEIINERVLAG